MLKEIVTLFLIGHILGDYYLQSDELARNKNTSFAKLVQHGLIYLCAMVFSLVPVFGIRFLKWALFVSLIHFLIDAGMFYVKSKNRFTQNHEISIYLFDQFAHLANLLVVSGLIYITTEPILYTRLFNTIHSYLAIASALNWLLAIAIVMQPVSVTINKMLMRYQPTTVDAEEMGHPGAGAFIGILERLIILVMLSQNQYGAIGFVLTAKSIARYNKIAENPQFSEYYLLGTLLSMLLVIMTYLLIFG